MKLILIIACVLIIYIPVIAVISLIWAFFKYKKRKDICERKIQGYFFAFLFRTVKSF